MVSESPRGLGSPLFHREMGSGSPRGLGLFCFAYPRPPGKTYKPLPELGASAVPPS